MKYVIAITLLVVVFCILILYIRNTESFSNNTDQYIVDIATGANHSVFLTKHGKIYSCGKNINGRLGTGNNNSVMTPVSIDNTIHIRKIFAGNVNTFYLTDDGTLYASGENSQGQLGIGTLDNQLAPVSIPFFKSNNIKIVKVAPGWYHTLFLTTTNDVYACGDNRYGQLSIGSNTNTNVPVKLNIKCRDIAAGQGHSVFLRQDYHLFTAGWNWYGQLGNNTSSNSKSFFHISSMSNTVRKVYAGLSSTFILNTQGQVWVCGDNTNGQLALNRNITNQRIFKDVGQGVSDISVGHKHTLFLMNNGDVYGVGSNEKGQLGIGHNNNIYHPDKLTYFNKNVSKISAGANHSIFLTKTGDVYASGDNTMGGQLGIKNITQTNIPELCDIEVKKQDTGLLYQKDIIGI